MRHPKSPNRRAGTRIAMRGRIGPALPMDLLDELAAALLEPDPDRKMDQVARLLAAWPAEPPRFDRPPPADPPACGRPERPVLVPPREVPRRSLATVEGRAALIHAVAHIEFSAINLALDHAWRFRGLPGAYHRDWLGVAAEECAHFRLLRDHLRSLGFDYGAFPAHDGLWQMAVGTARDALARMALVPRLLEARGLDATPPIQRKLEKAGDPTAARLLDVILADEVGHVALGDKWFRHLCAGRGLDPEDTYRRLIAEFGAPRPQAPMNESARRAAGFSAEELRALATPR